MSSPKLNEAKRIHASSSQPAASGASYLLDEVQEAPARLRSLGSEELAAREGIKAFIEKRPQPIGKDRKA